MKLGGVMAGSIMLFFFLGLSADKLLGNKGFGIMIGVIVGVAGGFLFLFKELGRISELETPQTKEDKETEKDALQWPKKKT